MQSPLNAVGQTYRDFIITKYLPLNELQSTLVELVHEPSGAKVMYIANSDPENLFCISLQTLPSSSNGIAHILEHTVLCGSEKFPVKDPFFAMTRRSLNTFMNALTGQDFTCYPASSQVEKDFYNLLEVYLDAVFRPKLKKTSFLQEGWRLEFADSKGLLRFQGVVFNEMKGAMSSPESRLWEGISKRLTPDLPYAYNSGGDPKNIPSLTYEELLEFHRNFYHPSRGLFFFYGNLPLAKHLDFLLEKTLRNTGKIPPLAPLPMQPRFQDPVAAVERYPISEGEPLEKKTQIAFSWLTLPLVHQGELLALSLLDSILTDTDASPLKLALLKSELCTQVESMMDLEMSEVPWTLVCKGCEEKDIDALKTVLFETLEKAASKPFPPEEVEASLHQLEFQRMEIGGEGIPFGLTLFMRAALIKQHGSEPENGLLIHSLFADLRRRVSDPSYLPSLLRKYLIENRHFVQLIFRPDPKLEKEEQEAEQRRLSDILQQMTPEEKTQIAAQTQELAAYQEAVEHQSLECLPKVSLRDVPPHARDFLLREFSHGKIEAFHHECFTNQILYADLGFDLPEIRAEDLSLLSLFVRLLPEVGCGGRSYAENLAYQQAYIGGFDASLSLHITQDNPDVCRPTFSLRGKALHRNSGKLFSLFADYAGKADFTDEERIHEWLQQHATDLEEDFIKNATGYAIQIALSGFSVPSYVYSQFYGLPYYRAVLKWAKEFDRSLLKELQRIQDLVLGLKNPHLVLSCDSAMAKNLPPLSLPERPFTPWKGKYSLPKVESHAHLIPAPVAFTASGLRTVSYRDPASAYLLISTELMENLVLHKEIREKGGAYGSKATYSPPSGNFHFYSYRDPHLTSTVESFRHALDRIAAGQFNERELEEAKLGVIQTLDAPIPPGSRGMVAYSWKRAGRTYALREAYRKQIITAGKQEIAQAVQRCLVHQPRTLISFLGQELYEKEKMPSFPIEV